MENIGKLLKDKRLELGLTVEQVSEKTRLTTKHIKALEEGDISFFKDDLSYLRFFVKSYCDVVGIDFDDIKEELRNGVADYTATFTNTMVMQHEEMEKHISETELSKVASAPTPRFDKLKTSMKRKKPDFSLVSLIAVVSVVIVVLALALVLFFNANKGDKKTASKQPDAPVQDETSKEPTKDTDDKEETPKAEKELVITQSDEVSYTITGYNEGDEITFTTQFIGSNSGYSVTVDGKVLEDPKAAVYNASEKVPAKVTAKKGTRVQLYIGFLLNTTIKINDKTVKIDESIANAGASYTFEFVFG